MALALEYYLMAYIKANCIVQSSILYNLLIYNKLTKVRQREELQNVQKNNGRKMYREIIVNKLMNSEYSTFTNRCIYRELNETKHYNFICKHV